MAKKFENIQIGDQLEQKIGSGSIIYGSDINPDAVAQVAIVTDIWFDPVDAKEYVGLAKVRNNGTYGKPTEKRTLTGLARSGWEVARKDWCEFLKTVSEADKKKVINFRRRK